MQLEVNNISLIDFKFSEIDETSGSGEVHIVVTPKKVILKQDIVYVDCVSDVYYSGIEITDLDTSKYLAEAEVDLTIESTIELDREMLFDSLYNKFHPAYTLNDFQSKHFNITNNSICINKFKPHHIDSECTLETRALEEITRNIFKNTFGIDDIGYLYVQVKVEEQKITIS